MFSSLEALDQFFKARETVGIKPGLDRMERLLNDVQNPQLKVPMIHVAGTNGKGSTVTYLASILQGAGYQVGTFTSPSLTNRQAMIQLNGEPISDEVFLSYANQLAPELTKLDQENNPASLFEIIVAIAFMFFADHSSIAVVETGMGGLEDATNLVDPIVSIITSIGCDHTAFLGETIADIAKHKAGIIKPNKPIIVGKMVPEAAEVIKEVSIANHAPLYQLGTDFQVIWIENRPYYKDENQTIPLRLRLLGEHQFLNTALAIKTIALLNEMNRPISKEQIKLGIRQAHLPARFEQISDHPVIIIDGAHNLESIQAFLDTVNKLYKNVEKHLIFAAFRDKPIKEMLTALEPHFDQMSITTFEHARAASADQLFNISNHQNKQKFDDWKELLNSVRQDKLTKKVTFVVGSLDFVGKVREYFK